MSMKERAIVGVVLILLVSLVVFLRMRTKKSRINTKFIAKTSIFAAFSIILYLVPVFNFELVGVFPSFLKMHFDEVPVFIAGFAYGPLSAGFILIIKTLAKLPISNTHGVGELADLIYSAAFILPAAFIYKKTMKSAIMGLIIGAIIQVFTAATITTFAILPFYMYVMGLPKGFILGACQAINKNITDLSWPFFFYVGLPFNALKDVMVVVITMVLYKRLHRFIDEMAASIQ